MTKPDISGIAPFFIVKNVPAGLSLYRDHLGFDITFQAPSDDDIFFGIVRRGTAMIILKAVGVEPDELPNWGRFWSLADSAFAILAAYTIAAAWGVGIDTVRLMGERPESSRRTASPQRARPGP